MIIVTLSDHEMRVQGHATRGRKASLQVCAATSTTLWTLHELTPASVFKRGLSVFPMKTTPQLLFAWLGLRSLARQFPGNIRIVGRARWEQPRRNQKTR